MVCCRGLATGATESCEKRAYRKQGRTPVCAIRFVAIAAMILKE